MRGVDVCVPDWHANCRMQVSEVKGRCNVLRGYGVAADADNGTLNLATQSCLTTAVLLSGAVTSKAMVPLGNVA